LKARRTDGQQSEAEYRLLLPGWLDQIRASGQSNYRHGKREMEYTGVIQDVTEARVAAETLGKLRSSWRTWQG